VWGQSEHTAKLIEGAKREKEVVVYGTMDLRGANLLNDKFRERYPFVDVKLNRFGSGNMVPRALAAADKLKAEHGIDCEVVDVRSLVPLDTQTILGSVGRTHRLFTVEENPRLCGWGAEIVSIVADEAFYDLDGPPVRITTPHIPLPAADILEDIALPNVERIVDRVHRSMQG